MQRHISRGALAGTIFTALALAGFVPPVAPHGVPSAAAAADPPSTPNVVYILVDDMRTDEMRFLPRTRRLIGDPGMDFGEAIAPHPLCCPARAQIVTGQYGQNNGVQHNTGPYGGYQALSRPRQTIGVWARRAGYKTALHGKYLNGYRRVAGDKKQPGWNRWDPLVYGTYDYVDFGFFDGDRYRDDYVTTRLTQRSVASIRRFAARGEPFLVMVNHVAPHGRGLVRRHLGESRNPIGDPRAKNQPDPGSPGSFDDPAFNRADAGRPADMQGEEEVDEEVVRLAHSGRAASLEAVDRSVARTVRVLRRTGALDDTVVVFASDNGFLLGEHRLLGKNLLYDQALSIPLMVRGPGVAQGGSDRVVTLVDVTTTLVRMMGLAPTVRLDGEDMSPLLEGRGFSGRDSTLVQTGSEVSEGALHPGWAYRGVQTDRYIYGRDVNSPTNEILFDRLRDPHELSNVASDPAYGAVRAELAQRTQALTDCSGEECNRVFGQLPAPSVTSE